MIFQHHRFQIWNLSQHPYKHPVSEFYFAHDALPGVTNLESALNYILAVLYPQTQESVANVAALPSVGNTINDFRVVTDDGDGNSAAYRWEQREGDAAAKWYKIYDMDWGSDSILEGFLTKTQDLYVMRRGYDDLDYTGAAVTGDYAGQRIYGGKSYNTNLTLSANSGDTTGPYSSDVSFNALYLANGLTADYAAGTTTVTNNVGSTAVDGNGSVVFAGSNYIDYSPTSNIGNVQKGAVNFVVERTLVSGSELHSYFIICNSVGSGLSALNIYYDTGASRLYIESYTSAGVVIDVFNVAMTQVLGDRYEIEYNWDYNVGTTYLYINGVEAAARTGKIGTRGSCSLFRIGANQNGSRLVTAKINCFTIYTEMQHTSAYTPKSAVFYDYEEADSGYVQFTDMVRPTENNKYDFGTTDDKWKKLWTYAANIDTLTITTGSIVDSTGAISFDNENLSTTGSITGGQVNADNLRLDGSTLSSTDTNGNINIVPDGSGIVDLSSKTLTTTGTINAGLLNVDNIRIDANTISSTDSNGDINITPNGSGNVYLAGGILQTSATAFTAHSHQTNYHVDRNFGNISGALDYAAAVIHAYASPTTAAITGHVEAIHAQVNVDGDKAVTDIRAVNGMGRFSGSNTATLVSGGYFEVQNTSTGTITTAASLYCITPTNTGGGTVTNSYALYADGNAAIIGTLTVTGEIKADNLSLNGNTLSSLDTNGNVVIDPNGSGLIEMGAAFYAATDDSFDIGKTGNRFSYAWLSGGVKDGTNVFTVADLMALKSNVYRDAGRTQPAQSGDALFYNGSIWLASAPDSEIDHGSLTGIGDDDHTQYALLAGRASGQSLTGGTAASESLTLESTSHGTKGSILFSSNASPTTNAAYSGGWNGTDMGDATHYWRHVYTKGEFFGLRLENVTSLTGASANNAGRLVFHTTNQDMYVDVGGSWSRIGINRFIEDTSWNGSDTSKTVTVSASIEDARNCIWQLCDNTNDYERIFCSIKAISATQVTITTGVPFAAGSYRLIGIE